MRGMNFSELNIGDLFTLEGDVNIVYTKTDNTGMPELDADGIFNAMCIDHPVILNLHFTDPVNKVTY